MHSSMMRTARSLTVSRSIRWGGGSVQSPLDADPLMQTPWMQNDWQAGVKT